MKPNADTTWVNPRTLVPHPALRVAMLERGDRIEYEGHARTVELIHWRRREPHVFFQTGRFAEGMSPNDPHSQGWVIAPAQALET